MEGYNPYAPPARDPAPAGPAFSGGPTMGPQPWTISEVLNVGFSALKQRPVELIGGYFLVGLLSQLPAQLPNILSLTGVVRQETPVFWVLQAVSGLGALIIGSFLWVGQIRVALAAARQQPFEFGLFFSGADRFLPTLGVNLLLYFGALLGFLLLIIPGVVLALGWALAAPLVVDAGYSPTEALRESWERMRGNKMQMFLLLLVSMLVCLAGLCACYVGLFAVLPALFVAYAEVYRRVTGRMDSGAAGFATFASPAGASSMGGAASYMTPPRTH